MSHEYLDLVDEDGNPTGEREDREIIHATGLRHRTAHLWLMRKREGQVEILLQKRSADKDSYPNCYDISSAGHIPAGMDFIPSALRELQEELGLTATADELVLCGQRRFFHRRVFHGKPFLDHQVSNVYVLIRDVDPAALTLQESEVQCVLWMPLCEVRRRVEASDPDFCIVLEEVEILERAANKLFSPVYDRNKKEKSIMNIHDMQNLNRATIEYIQEHIHVGMPLSEVKQRCEDYLLSHGADSFWYWDVGAFIFSGKETTQSVSGREYRISDTCVEANDIITIDLSPQRDNIWGDLARTIIIENGQVVCNPDTIQNKEWREGIAMEKQLHREMMDFVTPDTTFHELFEKINQTIVECGYVNLDFLGNLGHSIVKNKKHRIYTERGNHAKLSSVEAFTFEPHIALPGSLYGFKHENIYAFVDGRLIEF